jgi:hypothetical protein
LEVVSVGHEDWHTAGSSPYRREFASLLCVSGSVGVELIQAGETRLLSPRQVSIVVLCAQVSHRCFVLRIGLDKTVSIYCLIHNHKMYEDMEAFCSSNLY